MTEMVDGLRGTEYAAEIIAALHDPEATVNGLSYSSVGLSYLPPNSPAPPMEHSGRFVFSNTRPWRRLGAPSAAMIFWPTGNLDSEPSGNLGTVQFGAEPDDDTLADPDTPGRTDETGLAKHIVYWAVIGERALARASATAAMLQENLYDRLGVDANEIVVAEAANSDAPLGIIEIYNTKQWFGLRTVTRAVLWHVANASPRWVLGQMQHALQKTTHGERVDA